MLNDGISKLGAGDLIDRSVRFYRRYFWTFLLIASPPVIIGTIVSVAWSIAGRQIFSTAGDPLSAEATFYSIFSWFGTVVIWLTETIITLVVMGAASRNFVRHLLFGERIGFKETYRNVWSRVGGLLFASSMIVIILGSVGAAIMYFALFLIAIAAAAIIWALGELLMVAAIVLSAVVALVIAYFATWLFFLAASRVAYVPQAMLVEGHGVFSAIGRSASLAGGSVRRLAALFVFTTVATYSALAILYVPIIWYASLSGVELFGFDAAPAPAWYQIANSMIWQISFILLSPVWTIGLCLLYVDERVRNEGYDIELMAAARLGEIPSVPSSYVNPLQPALADTRPARSAATRGSDLTVLDLRSR